ncbi:gelsolin-like protein 2 [Orbicella faveolata]|uniref:gelsolin-like protein 2 n=1 Tax=Orbicella faveolata TaxID=48498 RepID=UPI0009E42F91|nr:gelsolin-like protein 2 [Orbicella faveolata]
MTEVAYVKESVTPDNVYIIDNGLTLYLVNGRQSDKDERFKASQYINQLKSERGAAKSEVIDEKSPQVSKLPSGDVDSEDPTDDDFEPTIKKLSDASGQLEMTDVNGFSKGVLNSNDVFVVDTGKQCFIWVGRGASIDERRKSMEYAHNYLRTTKHSLVPVTCVKEGQSSAEFDAVF